MTLTQSSDPELFREISRMARGLRRLQQDRRYSHSLFIEINRNSSDLNIESVICVAEHIGLDILEFRRYLDE